MPTLPGWDSLDSVTKWHSFYEIAGIIFLALLVGAEVLAFQYGNRKDDLVAAAESLRSNQARQENEKTEARRQTEVTTLQRQLSEADKKVTELQERQAPRHLSEDQKAKLAGYLSGKPKGTVTIKANTTANDARAYADEIAPLFSGAGWTVRVDDALILGPDITGIWLKVRGPAIPAAAEVIHSAFKFAGIPIRDTATPSPTGPEPDEVWLQIGSK